MTKHIMGKKEFSSLLSRWEPAGRNRSKGHGRMWFTVVYWPAQLAVLWHPGVGWPPLSPQWPKPFPSVVLQVRYRQIYSLFLLPKWLYILTLWSILVLWTDSQEDLKVKAVGDITFSASDLTTVCFQRSNRSQVRQVRSRVLGSAMGIWGTHGDKE